LDSFHPRPALSQRVLRRSFSPKPGSVLHQKVLQVPHLQILHPTQSRIVNQRQPLAFQLGLRRLHTHRPLRKKFRPFADVRQILQVNPRRLVLFFCLRTAYLKNHLLAELHTRRHLSVGIHLKPPPAGINPTDKTVFIANQIGRLHQPVNTARRRRKQFTEAADFNHSLGLRVPPHPTAVFDQFNLRTRNRAAAPGTLRHSRHRGGLSRIAQNRHGRTQPAKQSKYKTSRGKPCQGQLQSSPCGLSGHD